MTSAPTISGDGASFFLTLPSVIPGCAPHIITISVDAPRVLMRILLFRQRELEAATIGTEGNPTAAMIEAFVSVHGVTTKTVQRGRQAAASLGLDFNDLELDL